MVAAAGERHHAIINASTHVDLRDDCLNQFKEETTKNSIRIPDF